VLAVVAVQQDQEQHVLVLPVVEEALLMDLLRLHQEKHSIFLLVQVVLAAQII
jgi:hypothetical protein